MAMAHHGPTFLTDFGEEKAGELANDAVGKAVKQSIFNPSLTTKKEGPTWSNYGMLWVVYDMAQFHRSSSMSKLSHFFTCDFVAQWLRQGLLKHFIHSGTS